MLNSLRLPTGQTFWTLLCQFYRSFLVKIGHKPTNNYCNRILINLSQFGSIQTNLNRELRLCQIKQFQKFTENALHDEIFMYSEFGIQRIKIEN